jgi:putative heme-binding domain-containing protein
LHAARSAGIRRDPDALAALGHLLSDRDPTVRREAAIALGKLGQKSAALALYHKLDESDPFVAWAIRHAIRQLEAWDKDALVAALVDPKRTEPALRLTDEAWALPVVEALSAAFPQIEIPAVRARLVANIAELYRRYPTWSGTWFGTDPLRGPFPEKTQDWTADGMTAVQQALTAAIRDQDAFVRTQAIAGLVRIGNAATPALRLAMTRETDATNLTLLAESLGKLKDPAATPLLANLLADPAKPESARLAAIDALNNARDPHSVRTRFALLYDPAAPAALVARALPELARAGFLPPNDLLGFFENPAPSVRAAAILSINVKKPLPGDLKQAVIDRLSDQDSSVRIAAMAAAGPLRLRKAIPQIMAIAQKTTADEHDRALATLCAMPDPRCVSAYLEALNDPNPLIQTAAESALRAIKRDVTDTLLYLARKSPLPPTTIASFNRILADFEPIREWKVIGPFPRTTPRIFLGEPSIDFQRPAIGAGGVSIAWKPRTGDATSGRLDLDDLKRNSGQLGSFGYDQHASPDLCAFAYGEVESPTERTCLMALGSSGTLLVTVNETLVYRYQNVGGRAYAPESDMISVKLRAGQNRILVQSRQGIGPWAFSVRVATGSAPILEPSPAKVVNNPERLRKFAATHDGDLRHGEELFFDPKGVGCARCHSAGGRGTASIGPDLTGLAAKYDRNEIIRSVLEPSSRLAIGYQSVDVATHDGRVTSGVIRSESATTLNLATAEAKLVQIPKTEIDERRPSQTSIMPDGLVSSLTVAEFADLVAYLSSLKQQNPAPIRAEK